MEPLGWMAAGAAAVLGLWRVSPAAGLPVCPLRAMTGLLCPGCGGTHALAALLRADLAGAMRANALVTLGLPLLAWLCGRAVLRTMAGYEPWPSLPRAAIASALVAMGVFTVWRNC